MKEVITTTATAAGTGFFNGLFSKWQTRRERRKSDMQMIHDTTINLVGSIRTLTEQNSELVKELMNEQKKCLELLREKSVWQTEREGFISEIEKLRKEVKALTKKVNELINEKKV